jgi:hypothetical protein
MLNAKATLNQVSLLADTINKDEVLQKHFDLTNIDDTFDRLRNISEKQHKYILALIYGKKRFALNKILKDLGFKENFKGFEKALNEALNKLI